MKGLLRRIAGLADSQPNAVAIRSGDVVISYRRLHEDVDRVAALLRRAGTASLGLFLDNGIEWIVVDLAAIRAGVRVVPLPWFFSSRQLAHAIEVGAVDTIACNAALPAAIAAGDRLVGRYGAARLLAIASASAPRRPAQGSLLSFTSGSTGSPKGILLQAAVIEATCRSIAEAVPIDRINKHLAILPYSTLLENIAGIYLPLMLGKCVVAEPAASIGLGDDLGLDPARLVTTLARVRPDSLIVTPQLLEALCLLGERGAIDTAALRFVAVGGARVGASLLERARGAGIPAFEGYGMTEFASVATLNTPAANRPGSVGRALPGVEIDIAPDGEILLTRGTGFCADPEPGAAPPLRTGDYGHLDRDGYLYVQGRKCNLILLANGRNVSPEWVETELLSSAAIAQAFVHADSASSLSALVLAADGSVDDAALGGEIGRVNAGLPPYARIRHWRRIDKPFTTANGLLTANGRLRRAAIRRRYPAAPAGSARTDRSLTSNQATQEKLPCP